MRLWAVFKQHLFFGTLLILSLAAMPIIAGLGLNTFNPGETISSSAVNDNFKGLEEQINHICRLPGQVIFSGLITADGSFDGPVFNCDGITLTPQDNGTEVIFNVEGIPIENLSIQVQPLGTADRSCAVVIFPSSFEVECFGQSGTGLDAFFYLTLIRNS